VPPPLAPADTIWYPGTPDWEAAGVVTISGPGEVTGIDIVWPHE